MEKKVARLGSASRTCSTYGEAGTLWQVENGGKSFYARFTCKLKHKPRCEPFGGDLVAAKESLARLLAENVESKDFDALKEPQKPGLTCREWAQDYFENVDPTRKAGGLDRERRSYT